MDPAIVSALSAVLGSIEGGSATIATAWMLALMEDPAKRDDPLKPFSVACRDELKALQRRG